MADFSYYPLQKALYEALGADSALSAIISGVYEHVPQGQDYPYVTIGDSAGSDWSTKTSSGMEYSVIINAWSRQGGRKETATILENIYRILHDADITVSLHKLVLIRFISSAIMLVDDGATYHGVMRFRALLEAQ